MRKLFLVLVMAAATGCYQSIVLPPAPPGEFRAVSEREAYRANAVLFLNTADATRARCALFLGIQTQENLLAPLPDGRVGLAQQPLVVFEVSNPVTVSGFEKRPGTLALVGFERGIWYTYFCAHSQALFGGTVGLSINSFRLPDRLLGEQYYRPSYYGGTPVVDFVNHLEYLSAPSGAFATNEFRFTFDLPGTLMRVIR